MLPRTKVNEQLRMALNDVAILHGRVEAIERSLERHENPEADCAQMLALMEAGHVRHARLVERFRKWPHLIESKQAAETIKLVRDLIQAEDSLHDKIEPLYLLDGDNMYDIMTSSVSRSSTLGHTERYDMIRQRNANRVKRFAERK